MEKLIGCLLGAAVGDALGLCREGLSRRRAEKLYPRLEKYQLFAGRGMGSDDTDHAAFTAYALLKSSSLSEFDALLRDGLRRWFLSLPAGIGWATLRSSVKVCVGARKSGVFSAGNGPVMRAPVLGVWAAEHEGFDLEGYVRASSEMTHTDARAFQGAFLVADLTRQLCRGDVVNLHSSDAFFSDILRDIAAHPEEETLAFAERRGWGKGITGFVYPTVAIVVQACLRHRDDYATAVREVIRCGGDADTTAAIVGGVLGARLGKGAIPAELLEAHRDWPVSLAYLESLPTHPTRPSYPATLARNLVFGGMIVGYGFRRLLPPY